eukprot:GHVP01017344.1.p1 GENE.GHVP01017344.1~~GHVP01017344.1.p1  ORF type:complete len:426 (+),score=78.09 GHVP01017344.1:69-1280(+)
MKKKEILFEACLTAASGITGLSIPQESPCSSHTVDCSSVAHQDAGLSNNPVVTYGRSSSVTEVKSYVSEEFNLTKFDIMEVAEFLRPRPEKGESPVPLAPGKAQNPLLSLMEEASEDSKPLVLRNWMIPSLRLTKYDRRINLQIAKYDRRDYSDVEKALKYALKEKYPDKSFHLHSLSAKKTDNGDRFFILWNKIENYGNQPIFIPLDRLPLNLPAMSALSSNQREQLEAISIFNKIYSELHPSESLDPNGKDIVKALLSLEKKETKKRAVEFPRSLISSFEFLDEKFCKVDRGQGFFINRGSKFIPGFTDGENNSFDEFLCIWNEKSRILSFGNNIRFGKNEKYKYILSLKEGERPEWENFFKQNGAYVKDVPALYKLFGVKRPVQSSNEPTDQSDEGQSRL